MNTQGLEVRELPPEHTAAPVVVNHAARKFEIERAYQRGAGDRFAALLVGMLVGSISGALLTWLVL